LLSPTFLRRRDGGEPLTFNSVAVSWCTAAAAAAAAVLAVAVAVAVVVVVGGENTEI
jgi:hypothetical protein